MILAHILRKFLQLVSHEKNNKVEKDFSVLYEYDWKYLLSFRGQKFNGLKLSKRSV